MRTCLLKVNKVIDPLLSNSDDMIKYIRENGLSRDSDLLAIFSGITPDMLNRWPEADLEKKKIVIKKDRNNLYFIDGAGLVTKMMGMHKTIVVRSDNFEQMPQMERIEYIGLMDLLCGTCNKLFQNEGKALTILGNEGNIHKAKQIIKEYEEYKNRSEREEDYHEDLRQEPVSLVRKIINFFSSLFGSKSYMEGESSSETPLATGKKRAPLSRQTKDLYSQIKIKNAPVIALSDYLELAPENEIHVDTIINEIRQNNLKSLSPTIMPEQHSTPYVARITLWRISSILWWPPISLHHRSPYGILQIPWQGIN
jgi:hypothetical protein